jgi:D-alanyl-D-alanine carboxypeptidase (penicillin-binding protein 5/6)
VLRVLRTVVVALGWSLTAQLMWCTAAQATVPTPDARAFYVVNGTTGEVLAAHHADAEVPIASITKLMTVIVALDHLTPDQVVTVSQAAARVGEERIPLRAGQRIVVLDLLKGALIQSANDAADALAAAAAGGDIATFVSWMNERARTLGLEHTHFVRADGLDAPGHVSSARDVAVLAEVAMRMPIVRSIVRERTDVIEDGRVAVHTWNDLLGEVPGLIGVKTGHTDDAGWCQVAAVRSKGSTIYTVILGSPSRARRNSDLQGLLAWGVSQYRTLTLVRRSTIAHAELGYGLPPVGLVATEPLVRVVRVGHPIVERIVAPSAVALPVRRGQRLGRIEAWAGRRLLGSRPLVAARSVSRPGVAGRLRWYATRTGHHLLGLFS